MVELSAIKEGVDMSAAAVTNRIRDLCEMSSLCSMLAEATLASSSSNTRSLCAYYGSSPGLNRRRAYRRSRMSGLQWRG
jgi:hypothetical protein